jgi:RNA polymerase sigma factor (sigma-70 family)
VRQGNVICASAAEALRPPAFPCSLPLRPAAPLTAAERGCGQRMKDAKQAQAGSDGRRAAWMAAAQSGDRAAYETLLRDCLPFITRLARRQGVTADRIDDVVQEVLLTVHRARATYDPRRSFDAWLRVIVERRAIDSLRRMRRQTLREVHAPLAYASHADQTVDLLAGIGPNEQARYIGTAVAGLPQRQREAVRHLMLEERSLGDTAALTGRSKGSLKVSLHRALNALRIKMDRGD